MLLVAARCVGTPASLGQETTLAELASHVQFLSQPALKGRAPGTRGSRLAQQYIESRFKAYGLVPWGQQKGYEVSFWHGKNIVGVLPGSDPNLASELVLVCAHYDHLGKDSKGRICPGAADDASGVAAMLETARQITCSGVRPKRSICFVAFDCEEKMLFGSFAFTCRKDVEQARIVAVVNLDILGRDFLDVVRNAVFVTGAEHYPEVRQQLRALGTQAGIRVFPVGTDLVGPRGDHAAFESRPIPCLFFSSGLYRDYHKPSDTADKLDYAELERASKVVLATVQQLASGITFRRSETTRDAEREELQSVSAIMSEVSTNCDRAGIKPEQAKALRNLAEQAETFLKNGQYDGRKRAEFVVGAVGILTPNLLPLEDVADGQKEQHQKQMAPYLQYIEQFYINHRNELMKGYREFVVHILKYRPGLFRGMPAWEYEIYDLRDTDIRLAQLGNGTFALDVLMTPLTLKAEAKRSMAILPSFSFGIFGSVDGIDCEGTREQLTDLCLLRLREEQTNTVHSESLRKVLKVVTGAELNGSYHQLLAERLQRGGFKSEAEWIASCIGSSVPDLAREAIAHDVEDKAGVVRQALCKVILDRGARPDVRSLAIERARPKPNKDVLLALCAIVDDSGPAFTEDFSPMLRPGYPFADRLEVKTLLPFLEQEAKHLPNASKTIGDLALAQLRKATQKDFGKDASKWQAWVQAAGHYR